MNWSLSRNVDLNNERIPSEEAGRQMQTAAEILRRFDRQPGVILADEVGMGKTFVALAVAVSVVEATNGQKPVVVMVPPSVQDKWPKEWHVFRQECLRGDTEIRATPESARRSGSFLKLLDDPSKRRNHIIFLTHGAFTNALVDPYIRLAIVRQAMLRHRSLGPQWRALPRWAEELLGHREFRNSHLVSELLDSGPRYWGRVIGRVTDKRPPSTPVPAPVVSALKRVDMDPLREVLRRLPVRSSKHLRVRLKSIRREITIALRALWKEYLRTLDIELPLVILDEAHHLKNPYTRLAGLFDSRQAMEDAEALRGPLAEVFDRMLFLTATPFQLGHHELLQVLRRFDGISWESGLDQSLDRVEYQRKLGEVERSLDVAQAAALRLDQAWGRLSPEDLSGLRDGWWRNPDAPDLPERSRQAALRVQEVDRRMREAEEHLSPWVIRHMRADKDQRRDVQPGRAILDEGTDKRGLEVSGPAVLPFLLAARAQALVSIRGLRTHRGARAYFAEGLASSFEAYRHTRRPSAEGARLDDDVDVGEAAPPTDEIAWYLHQVDRALPDVDQATFGEHPKVMATVRRVLHLWRKGEKCSVFCFYVETGRALRRHISRAIHQELVRMGAQRLGIDPRDEDRVRAELERIGRQFFDEETRLRRAAQTAVRRILGQQRMDPEDRARVLAIVLRFLRTESFLVRYMDISASDLAAAFEEALDQRDASGMMLRTKISDFARFVAQRVPEERAELFEALEGMQTGSIYVEAKDLFDPSEGSSGREEILPNVRLANGSVLRATRHRLMLAFNTPFFPEVLIASAVMAEGVDLHLNCRFLIHHDLDWNPSILEQRTGRLDRIGSKSETTGNPIVVYEPFLEATQDEKQYRVVKDRERWFSVVMGERMELNESATDLLADRIPLHPSIAKSLALRLEVARS